MPDEGPTGEPVDKPDFNQLPSESELPSVYLPEDTGALPPGTTDGAFRWEYLFAIFKITVGALFAIAGVLMIFFGVTGAVDLTFNVGDSMIDLKTAVVGIVMAVIGALIIILTRPLVVFGKKNVSRR